MSPRSAQAGNSTRRASVKEVAARAGVSLGTVSNVLNRPDSVRPETRRRVEEAMEELHFVRNDSARQLRAGHSNMLAFLTLDYANPFFTDVARGMEGVAAAAGVGLFLCSSHQDARRETEYLERLQQQRVRGVCVTAVDYSNPLLRTLPEVGIPVVLVDRAADSAQQEQQEWCSVGVNDVAGGELAVAHLLEQGHQRIGFVGGALVPQVVDRLAGARAAVSAAGGDKDAILVLDTEEQSVAEGRRAGQRLLGIPKRRRPTAVFCANDMLALGMLQQLTQRGVSVPHDVAIVGYDNIDFAAAAAVPLTSVNQPRLDMGRAAAELVLAERQHPSHKHRHLQLETELVVRESSVAG